MSASVPVIKNIFEMNRQELNEYNESKLQEFKELFLTTDLSVDEIYDKIGVGKNDPTYRYINGMRKKEGCSAKDRKVNFNIIEQSTEERNKELENFYQDFKKIWLSDPKISKKAVFDQLGKNQTKERIKYVNNRLKEENLVFNHAPNYFKNKPRKNKRWGKTVKNVRNSLNTDMSPEEAYNEYKDLFLNTELSIGDIYDTIGVPQNQNTHYTYIREQAEKEGLNGYRRRLLLKHSGRPKGSKNLKSLKGKEKEDQENYFEEMYVEFLEYYKNPEFSVQEILKIMGTHHKSNMYFYFRRRMKEDGLDVNVRKGEVLSRKLKKTYEQRRKDNKFIYEECYQEYKKLFLNTNLSIKEIYEELDLNPRSSCGRYVIANAKKEGLNVYKRRWYLYDRNHIDEDEQIMREKLYSQFKELFINTEIPVMDIYKKLEVGYNSKRGVYIRDKAHEEGLNGNRRGLVKAKIEDKDWEELYRDYKNLFNNSKYRIDEILNQIGVGYNTFEHKYIRKRALEEGLDGRQRMYKLKREKIGNVGRKEYAPNSCKGKHRKRMYSSTVIKQVEDSNDTLNDVFTQRNIQEGTKKGYIACMYHWFNFIGNKFSNLKENIEYYIKEEDDRLPMRERTIKKDLLGFREYLINCETMNTKQTIMSYYAKITAIFRHYDLEVPTLPPVKLEKGYVSNYNDLPTHDMIREACDQSPLVLKSILLFMSSSGSAKAETLSITVGMFLKGCREYLKESPSPSNIKECVEELKDKHNIIPLIYLRRIKTDKWYYTCCSPEASYMIIEYLSTCDSLNWEDKLFPFTPSLLLDRFQKINDNNNWGHVGAYRRFRAHALRKFMASNIGLPRDQVDSFQGRSKDMIAEAYFKQDPHQLKKIYLRAMHKVMIYDNWGYEIHPEDEDELTENIPETPVKTSTNNQVSIADELLKYSQLKQEGFLTMDEFNQIKQRLLDGELQ